MRFNALFKPKTKSPNPIRARYEKITRFSQAFYLLNVKNTQKHQFDYQYSIKNFLHAL
ncbi:hypothetical protein [Helicobacter pylori]|uniref:hypothetical protein n=1 Tax=Helicobacter pylori TaxID=210 RepID=UPI00165145FF|nr:hypothetical protein [Helicobacter pylori]WQV75456.1 hypothetical protein KVJ71_00660 [Helicobacter pylori]